MEDCHFQVYFWENRHLFSLPYSKNIIDCINDIENLNFHGEAVIFKVNEIATETFDAVTVTFV